MLVRVCNECGCPFARMGDNVHIVCQCDANEPSIVEQMATYYATVDARETANNWRKRREALNRMPRSFNR